MKALLETLKVCGVALAGAGAILGATLPANAQEKKVTLAIGDQIRVAYYWLYLPSVLGYWKQDNITMDLVSVGGAVEAVQQVVAGHAQFGQMGANNVVAANSKEKLPLQLAFLNGVFQWKIGVKPGTGISKVADLKGKTIGLFSMTSNGNLFLKPYLQANGINPETDVKYLPVGFGGPALRALETGEVAALYYWPSAFVAYQNQGAKFDFFLSKDWEKYPDYSVAVHGGVAEKDPKLVVDVVRSMAKAAIFAEANPTCAVRLYWKAYPAGKPTDMPEDKALQNSLAVLQAQLNEYGHASSVFGKDMIGRVDAGAMSLMQDFLASSGQITDKVAPEKMVVSIPGFFESVNAFDKEAIRAEARACKS